MTIKEFYNFKILLWFNFAGLTILPFIFWAYSKENVPAYLRRHEMKHVEQQRRLGLKFYFLYVGEYVFNLFKFRSHEEAYLNISFEIEARKAEWTL